MNLVEQIRAGGFGHPYLATSAAVRDKLQVALRTEYKVDPALDKTAFPLVWEAAAEQGPVAVLNAYQVVVHLQDAADRTERITLNSIKLTQDPASGRYQLEYSVTMKPLLPVKRIPIKIFLEAEGGTSDAGSEA